MHSGDLSAVERALAEAARDRAEQEHLRAQHGTALADLDVADAALTGARAACADEEADVVALESWSPTRIWAGLRGSRDVDLSREQAELKAAQYAVATAEHRQRSAAAVLDQVEVRLQEIGDAGARYEAALSTKADLLVATETGPSGELVELAQRLGVLAAEGREIDEADAAGREASERLHAAVALLENAHSWATWDTFGGGGLVTDAIKYDRMDQASRALREADERLRRLRVELADVDLSGVPEVGVDALLQTFDIWFDNIFSDWSVRSRITDALAAATRARDDVQQVAGVLRGRRDEVEAETALLTARRTQILTG